jgi:L-alanine-DL-glutamate epimerase-like enolase superfamily enzyme
MKIQNIAAYTAELTYAGKAYAFAGGRSHTAFTTTVVVLTTDTGMIGFGEVCPCGPNYMPAFAEGIPACLSILAPSVLGQDPTQTAVINERMNQALTGHAVAKAASTHPRTLLNTTDLHNYNTTQLAEGAPEVSGGRMTLSDRPGLGVTPDFTQLTLHEVYE